MKELITLLFVTTSLFMLSCDQGTTSEVETPSNSAAIDSGNSEMTTETLSFFAADSLEITADVYRNGDQPWMVLFHQARWSRGEYQETAPLFAEMGYNCLAVDQRSGGEVNDVKNETFLRAQAQGLGTEFYDALPDLEAAINFAFEQSGQQPVIIVGSSYSSALVFKAGVANDKVKAIVSFSPGEYYRGHTVADWLKDCTKPVFVTSAKSEKPQALEVLTKMNKTYLTHFTPISEGNHGSRALWEKQNNEGEYWAALTAFLERL